MGLSLLSYVFFLSLERLTYWILWVYPQLLSSFRESMGWKVEEPYILQGAVMTFKLVQMSVMLEWTYTHVGGFWNIDLMWYTPFLLAIALFGQHLNYMVWKKLGVIGTCYGIRYKHKYNYVIPWVTSYPYSVWTHPQYVGCIMFFWATMALYMSHPLWWQIPTAATIVYCFSMVAEK